MKSPNSFSGPRIVICPATNEPEEIELDDACAALTAESGQPELRIARCGRWPAHRDCDQACLRGADPAWVEKHGLVTPAPPGIGPRRSRR